MNERLTAPENKRLQFLERIIHKGKLTWVTVGLAVTEIRDRKLYRAQYSTFEDYCHERWGWGRSRLYQLVGATAVVQQLPPEMSTIVDTESKARALAQVPEDKREQVLKRAKKGKKKVTAKAITEAAKEEQAKPTIELDGLGRQIPQQVVPYWNRADEVQRLLTAISHVKSALKKAQDEKDLMFAEVNFSTAIGDLGKAWTSLKCALPYAVCPTCQGRPDTQPNNDCRMCCGRGLVSKYRWDRLVPDEMKKLVLGSARHAT